MSSQSKLMVSKTSLQAMRCPSILPKANISALPQSPIIPLHCWIFYLLTSLMLQMSTDTSQPRQHEDQIWMFKALQSQKLLFIYLVAVASSHLGPHSSLNPNRLPVLHLQMSRSIPEVFGRHLVILWFLNHYLNQPSHRDQVDTFLISWGKKLQQLIAEIFSRLSASLHPMSCQSCISRRLRSIPEAFSRHLVIL